jgi:hypothetical protein
MSKADNYNYKRCRFLTFSVTLVPLDYKTGRLSCIEHGLLGDSWR